MNGYPPKWADRFLAWYCNPDLLEEIQGDAHELYFERLRNEGKASADRKYVFDIIRFCRWSNIKRPDDHYQPGYFGVLWNLNLKIALRDAGRNKLAFSIRMMGLSICLAFALVLSALVIHEFTFDRQHVGSDRIFRVGTEVGIAGVITNYAVSPVALGDALEEEIPEVESAFSLMYNGKPVFIIGDEIFNNEITFLAKGNFLKVFTFDFVRGSEEALDEPNKIVLTETTAAKFFGESDPIGQTVNLNWTQLEVTAIIKDVAENSHLKFDALISWDTHDINEGWDNVNAYTYIKLKSEKDIRKVQPKIDSVMLSHREEIEGGRDHWSGDDITVQPIVENITDIHLSENLDEDVAEKRSISNVYILMAMVVIFFIKGLVNFLNQSLAELTTNLKKIGILAVFGGTTASHGKVMITNTLISICIVLPSSALLSYCILLLAESYFFIYIEKSTFINPLFIIVAGGFILVFIFSSRINSFVLSRSNNIINALKGKLSAKQNGLHVRELLVATQLSFSIIMIALIIIIVDQFRFVNSADKGFEDRNTIVIRMRDGDFSKTEAFEESVRKLSGVKKVDGSSFYLDNIETKEFFEIDTESGERKMLVAYMNCGYEYLVALNIKVLKGRNFQKDHRTDDKGAYIVNETAVKEFGWNAPIGQRIRGPVGTDRDEGEVIGVVKDFNFASLHSKVEPLILFLVNGDWGIRYVYIKINPIRPGNLISQMENEYKKSFGGLPFEWEYLDSKYMDLYKEDLEMKNIFQAGLIISVLISCLGVFSISSLLVIMRAREMGIRKIVGADQWHLFSLHMRRFLKFIVIASFIAWPVVYYLSRYWLDNFAYHIELSVWYFIIPCLITLLIILVTSSYHGLKSSRVNLVNILKHE